MEEEMDYDVKKTSLKTVINSLGEFEYPVNVFVDEEELVICIPFQDEEIAKKVFEKIFPVEPLVTEEKATPCTEDLK